MAARTYRKAVSKAGFAPGTLVHTGERKVTRTRLTVTTYDRDFLNEQRFEAVEPALAACDPEGFTWLNVDGLHDTAMVARIGEHFRIHSLTLEDVLHTGQRPKAEAFERYEYIVLKMLRLDQEVGIVSEQVSLILTPTSLISFQESEGDVFETVRDRLRKGRGHLREGGGDYLAYALLDALVDQYFVILDHIAEQVDQIEEEILGVSNPETLQSLHRLKRSTLFLHRNIRPLREVITALSREEGTQFRPDTRFFLRDVLDHTLQVIDTIESYRELLSSLLEIYLSSISNRMNEIMKVLTIIATLFIPVTFIAGIYGMNFRYMPELAWRWGYPLAWAVMLGMMIAMLLYFKKKNWL